jgi:hypothetical protein
MSNKTVYTLIAAALLFGAIKGFNNVSFLSPRTANNLQQIDWKNADLRPYQRGDLENDPEQSEFAEKQRNFKIAKAGTFSNQEIGAKKLANPVVAKADTKDKKKKKKKKKKELAKSLPGSPFGRQPSQKATDKNQSAANDFNPPPSAMPAAMPAPMDDEEKSFEEWSKLLLARPDKVLVDKFIREFQSNLVTANVYYAVLDLMFQENDPRYKELAVRAAGAFTSLQSYDFLLMVVSKEPNTRAANQAQSNLYDYSSPMALQVLQTILATRASDETALTYALNSLESSTLKFLTRSEGAAEQPVAAERHYKRMYLSFVGPLKNIISLHANNNFATIARRTLERIQGTQTAVEIEDPTVVADN